MLSLAAAALLTAAPASPFPRAAASSTRITTLGCSVATDTTTATFYPAWPAGSTRGDVQHVLTSFEEIVTSVPLRASSETGDGWRAWSDGGYAAQKFLASKLSRQTYESYLVVLCHIMEASQARYPDLYAVLKFVPKKNGLNPLLAKVQKGPLPPEARLTDVKPREVRRRLDDTQRALEQSWLLLSCYLTLPKGEREDMLWSARTVVEKIKTDQRSRALELLCLGCFHRDASLYPAVTDSSLRRGFEKNFGVDSWHPKPTNARMIWQRCRMVYPYLEVAHRAWLDFAARLDDPSPLASCSLRQAANVEGSGTSPLPLSLDDASQ